MPGGESMERHATRCSWHVGKLLDKAPVARVVLQDGLGSFGTNVEGPWLSLIVELVEGNPPRSAEATAALLDEDILEGLGGMVEAEHSVVGEVAHKEVLTWEQTG